MTDQPPTEPPGAPPPLWKDYILWVVTFLGIIAGGIVEHFLRY